MRTLLAVLVWLLVAGIVIEQLLKNRKRAT